MRNKIVVVNAVIVLIVGLLSYVIVNAALTSTAGNHAQLTERAKHDAQGAAARLQLDGLRAERWLSQKTSETLEALYKASPNARGEAATKLADDVLNAAKSAPAFEGAVPSLVVLVDWGGRVIGRNGSSMSRGDDLGALYPGLKDAIAKVHTGSDIWLNQARNDQYLASYAPVVDGGVVKGAIVIGITLNDELSRVSDATTGRGLLLAVPAAGDVSIAAKSSKGTEQLGEQALKDAKDQIKGAIASGHSASVSAGNIFIASAPLENLGDGKRGAIVAAAPTSLVENAGSIPLGIFLAMALGIALVIVGGVLLGNYISRPINTLEEGLLAILNGQHDKRFELDHAELGGLAFRIDQLLNQLMGVEEDTTDEEGRISRAPDPRAVADAMNVGGGGGEDAAQLAAEPAAQYYARLFQEYIAAKRALGEETSHITQDQFVGRIQGMEREASAKHGKPVRYRVQSQNREVQLLAIPLG
jgi:hypothetical protein